MIETIINYMMKKRGKLYDIAKVKSQVCAHLGGNELIDCIYQGAVENLGSV